MEENKISIGLDIGTTKIVAMIGKRNEYEKYYKTQTIEVRGVKMVGFYANRPSKL